MTVENNWELFKTFSDWGIAGVKIDFMNRSDQWMVNFYEKVAKEAAKNKLIVDFMAHLNLQVLNVDILMYFLMKES